MVESMKIIKIKDYRQKINFIFQFVHYKEGKCHTVLM